MMNIGVRLHDCAGQGLDEKLAACAEQGFTCAHIALHRVIPGFTMDEAPRLLTESLAKDVKASLKRHGIHCVLLGCYLNLAHPDPAAYERTAEIYRAHLRFAKWIGADMVGTETGAPNPTYTPTPVCWTDESLALFIDRLTPIVNYARSIGQPIAIEPVCRHIVSTPVRCEKVVKTILSPMLRVILDPVNLLRLDNVDQADAIFADAIDRVGPWISLLHLKDYLPGGTHACKTAQANVPGCEMYDGVLSLACGMGMMDYQPWLKLAREQDLPITLENTAPSNARQARLFLEALARF